MESIEKSVASARRIVRLTILIEGMLWLLSIGLVGFFLALGVGAFVNTGPTFAGLRFFPFILALLAIPLFVFRRSHRLFPWEAGALELEHGAQANGHSMQGDILGALQLERGLGHGSRELKTTFVDSVALKILEAKALRGLARSQVRTLQLPAAIALWGTLLAFLAMQNDKTRDTAARLWGDAVSPQVASQFEPIVTNISVTLVFPAYMNRAPTFFEGSNGDILAPPGTEVRLSGRSIRTVKGAFIRYENDIALSVAEDGRSVSGQFTITDEGSYSFGLEDLKSNREISPIERKVALEPDNPPRVEIQGPEDGAVLYPENPMYLLYSADDDFGLTEVRLVVSSSHDGEPRILSLDTLEPVERRKEGRTVLSMEDLQAQPGETLQIQVEAFDNDTVSGPKSGLSAALTVTIFSEAIRHRELIQQQQALLDELVDRLADELETPTSAMNKAQAEPPPMILERHIPLRERLDAMVMKFTRVISQIKEDTLTSQKTKNALQRLASDLTRAVKRKNDAVAAAEELLSRKPSARNGLSVLAKEQQKLISNLEKNVIYLDDLLATQRFDEIQALAEELTNSQEQLRDLMESFRQNPDKNVRERLLEEVAAMRKKMRTLSQRLSELRKDVPDEHLNAEAFENDSATERLESMEELIESGKIEEALEQLEGLNKLTDQLLSEIQNDGADFADGAGGDLGEELDKVQDELEKLQRDQKKLTDETDRLANKKNDDVTRKTEQKMKRLWKELLEKTNRVVDLTRGINAEKFFPHEREQLESARERLDDLKDALAAEDLLDASEAARGANQRVQSIERDIADRVRGRFGVRARSMEDANDRLTKARPTVEEIYAALEKVRSQTTQRFSAAEKQRLRKNASKQEALQKKAEVLRKKMEGVDEKAPLFGKGAKDKVKMAEGLMSKAASALAKSDVTKARGHQRQVSDELDKLSRSLKKMRQGGGRGLPGAFPSAREGDGGLRGRKVKIPNQDAHKVPDAFRRDILDAMKERPPAAYEEDVKKYYEELVK